MILMAAFINANNQATQNLKNIVTIDGPRINSIDDDNDGIIDEADEANRVHPGIVESLGNCDDSLATGVEESGITCREVNDFLDCVNIEGTGPGGNGWVYINVECPEGKQLVNWEASNRDGKILCC